MHYIIDLTTIYNLAFKIQRVISNTYINCLKVFFNIQVPRKLFNAKDVVFNFIDLGNFFENIFLKSI